MSKIAELDDNNNMTTSGQYDVYGLPRAGTQQGVAATSSQGYVGGLGHITDQSTGGLIYMQARYYDPNLGRFVSEDPKQNGNNWYAYCNDNPTNSVDGTGEMPSWLTDMLAGLGFMLAGLTFAIGCYAMIAAFPLIAGFLIVGVGIGLVCGAIGLLVACKYAADGIAAVMTAILGVLTTSASAEGPGSGGLGLVDVLALGQLETS